MNSHALMRPYTTVCQMALSRSYMKQKNPPLKTLCTRSSIVYTFRQFYELVQFKGVSLRFDQITMAVLCEFLVTILSISHISRVTFLCVTCTNLNRDRTHSICCIVQLLLIVITWHTILSELFFYILMIYVDASRISRCKYASFTLKT